MKACIPVPSFGGGEISGLNAKIPAFHPNGNIFNYKKYNNFSKAEFTLRKIRKCKMAPDDLFSTRFRVRIGDINYGGHLGNDKFLLLFHDARIEFLQSLGLAESNIGDGVGLIMSEAHVNYKAEVFLGDELRVQVRVTDLQAVRFRMEYKITRGVDQALVATGFTQMAAFDYQQRRICKLPAGFRARVGEK
jgi:YbgC/YbaW family acyl-CoA thioester hydrolase